jgi:hypothetical protein
VTWLHWNVSGEISHYKLPAKSLNLAVKREKQGLREDHFSVEDMPKFIRDTIAT